MVNKKILTDRVVWNVYTQKKREKPFTTNLQKRKHLEWNKLT